MNFKEFNTVTELFFTQAKKLAAMFLENFKQFGDSINPEIIEAGPKL